MPGCFEQLSRAIFKNCRIEFLSSLQLSGHDAYRFSAEIQKRGLENRSSIRAASGVKALLRQCGPLRYKAPTSYFLRRSYAAHLLESGTGVRLIQELPGRSDIKITLRYTYVSAPFLHKIRSPLDTLFDKKYDKRRKHADITKRAATRDVTTIIQQAIHSLS
ncbi:MAG: hypothetical protein ACK4NS_13845, partial [Saprospiraceae bacterium]